MHKSLVTCHMSHVRCHMSHVTFNLSLTQTATDLPMLIPPLFTVGWFQIHKNPNYSWTKNIIKIVVTFEPILQCWCPSRSIILRAIHTHSILWNKGQNGTIHGHPLSHFQPVPAISSYFKLIGFLELFGAIESYLELSWAIWSHLGPFGAVWSHLVLFGANWSWLETLEVILHCLEPLGVIWSHLSTLDPFGAT